MIRQEIKQFQDNWSFSTNKGRFFKDLKCKSESAKPPDVEEAKKFWKGILSISNEHNQYAE